MDSYPGLLPAETRRRSLAPNRAQSKKPRPGYGLGSKADMIDSLRGDLCGELGDEKGSSHDSSSATVGQHILRDQLVS